MYLNDIRDSADFLRTTAPQGVVRQRTLAVPMRCSGVGLHSGAPVDMVLRPAAADTGIIFRRTDMGGVVVPARHDTIVNTRLCSMLGVPATGDRPAATVSTVEHLMAALAAMGIDNLIIDIDGPEVPVMDGSSRPFIQVIERAGMIEQPAARRFIEVLKPVELVQGSSVVRLLPADRWTLDVTIDFANPVIGRERIVIDLTARGFSSELAAARTFGFAHEVEQMRAAGLGRGGSLDNAVVVEGDRVLNPEGLRYADEFVRHKALDAVGDLYLAGAPLLARFEGMAPGHGVNNALLHALFADPTAWRYTSCHEVDTARAVEAA
ncbi:UDP-3-O-acyl-N-acetylglucosamine deacetylase [Tistrella mobilis]